MDSGKGQGAYGGSQGYPGRRTREERRSLSESLADGTSKFFSSMVAKKNGLFNDLSSKIENTFAPKTDTVSNSTGSDGSASPPTTPPVPHTPPPRPPPPKRLPSMGSSREKENVMKRMASMPAYSRTDSQPEHAPETFSSARNQHAANHRGSSSEEKFSVNGMNISFDEPIYNKRDSISAQVVTQPSSTPPSSEASSTEPSHTARTRHTSGSSSSVPRPAPRSQKPVKANERSSSSSSYSDNRRQSGEEYGQGYGPTSSSSEEWNDRRHNASDNYRGGERRRQSADSNTAGQRRKMSADRDSYRSNTGSDRKQGSDSGGTSSGAEDQPNRQKAPMFTTTKRRSSTVDEMLFDEYIEPVVDEVIVKDPPPENLISFEPESEVEGVKNSPSSSSEGNDCMATGASVDSSDTEFGGAPMHRSHSVGSEKSWSSNYSVDSQPDDLTLECMEFMKSFVDKIFHESEDISQTEKAKFGELCQHFPGRLWFSRYVNSQRVHNKRVTEPIFFRLMQYFAVCLFECNEAEDFSPAKTLMNMCFTFYYEAPSPQGQPEKEKVFLYMYMRDQPIWQSLRFWNAAYFDAVQCERSRRPMPTNSDGKDTVTDDRQFQENITFGQLGTFACNMRAFGLNKDLCLEFLRKQSTIANLRKDQVKLLRDNIERVKET